MIFLQQWGAVESLVGAHRRSNPQAENTVDGNKPTVEQQLEKLIMDRNCNATVQAAQYNSHVQGNY